ncbi:MAG: BamA/TamA family outer membrane protein [Pseudomonadota bacterium]
MAITQSTGFGALRRLGVLGLVCAALLGCASQDFEEPVEFDAPQTSVDYEPEIRGAPDEATEALLSDSLLIFRRADDGAQSLAFLRRRAEGDIATTQKVLRSFGYYGAEVRAEVEAPEGADPTDAESVAAAEGPAIARIVIEAGPAFTLLRHSFSLTGFEPGTAPTLGPAEAYGSPVGRAAEAAAILSAETRAVADLRANGRVYAERTGRDAVADPPEATLEVETSIDTGRAYRYGPIGFSGAPNVDTAYLLTYLPWKEGDVIDTAKLSEYQRALLSTGLFRSGLVTVPEEPPEGEVAPVSVDLEEAPFRSVSAGGRFSTDEGPSVRLSFEHRNLFGANEQLRLTLDAGTEEQLLNATFRKPQYLRPNQDLVGEAELRRVEDDAFDELGGTISLGLSRTLTERWTVGFGGLIEISDIDDGETESLAVLGGIPLFAAYDSSDDLLNPRTGERLRLDLIPFFGMFDDEPTAFLSIDTRASLYRKLDTEGRFVGALRGRFGSIPSGGLDRVPATRRLYAGGSGSVRGFAEDFVGPLDDDNDPVGGRSVLEAGAELRFPIFGDLGGVAFVEAGSVSTAVFPDFDEGVQYAAGGGFRYYSPVGPIRFDVGFPINGREADDTFQFYISIGQAF